MNGWFYIEPFDISTQIIIPAVLSCTAFSPADAFGTAF